MAYTRINLSYSSTKYFFHLRRVPKRECVNCMIFISLQRNMVLFCLEKIVCLFHSFILIFFSNSSIIISFSMDSGFQESQIVDKPVAVERFYRLLILARTIFMFLIKVVQFSYSPSFLKTFLRELSLKLALVFKFNNVLKQPVS